MLRACDFASYSPMYPYKWENGGHVFGAVDVEKDKDLILRVETLGREHFVKTINIPRSQPRLKIDSP